MKKKDANPHQVDVVVKCKLDVFKESNNKWQFQLRFPILGFFQNYYEHEYTSEYSAIQAGKRCAKKFGWIIKNT